MEPVTPIPTRYRGRLFRSRLEARWAVFFETLLLPWEYEREGYPCKSKYYLPDFWLPRQKRWVEIKPYDFKESTEHLNELAAMTDYPVLLLEGQIPWVRGYFPQNDLGEAFGTQYFRGGEADAEYMFCRCEFCGEYGIEWMGSSGRIQCCPQNSARGKRATADEKSIVEAYDAARTRQFEHGVSEWD